MRVAVAQMGARMHYAIPRILEEAGCLKRLYTDVCASKGWPKLLNIVPKRVRPARLERLLTRVPKGIPPEKITAFTRFGFEYGKRLSIAATGNERDEAFLWAGPEFARLIRGRGLGGAEVVYAFNTAGKEIFQHATRLGIRKVLEQTISPRMIEQRLMEEEQDLFPTWEESSKSTLARHLSDREIDEWNSADLILCASEYVQEGIAACGGDVAKCRVVPYGIENRPRAVDRSQRRPGPLRVLTVGSVGLRKGSPYVMETAKLLKGLVEFRMTGPHHCSDSAVLELRRHLDAPGAVPRSEISEHYSWADVYLLPSLCEGSATSTYEAMFHGLPVICTPHTGSIVREGIDGFIVPARCPELIAKRIETLSSNSELLIRMSESALQRASSFTLEHYSENLLNAFSNAGISQA